VCRLLHSRHMNPKRLSLAIVAVFAGVWVTDFLIHGVWVPRSSKETLSLWRTEPEMQAHVAWMLLAQFLMAGTFVVLYAKGFADKACPLCAVMSGLFLWVLRPSRTPIPD